MKHLIFLLFLIIQITAFSADKKKKLEHDKNKAITNMNEEIDNFDNETDEEALKNLKKKTKDKSKDEAVTRPTEATSHPKKGNELKDTNINTENHQQKNTDNQTQYDDDDDNVKKDKNFKMVLTLGGGIKLDSFNYHPSNHFGGEILLYKVPNEGFIMSGFSLGAGVVKLDNSELYVSVAYSAMFLPISSSWGPFLRFDAGAMLWDDDILKTDEEVDKDGDTPPRYVGLLLKAGGGFLIGNETNGLSLQLLYTIHATTIGTNNGVELQVGLHF